MMRTASWTLLVIAMALTGCATPTVTYNPDIEPTTENLPVVAKKPLHAGIYYSPEFSGYEGYRRHGGISITAMKLGSASVAYLDELYSRVFEKTTRVTDLSPAKLAAQGIDIVVAPSFEHFDIAGGMQPYTEQYGLAYRTTVYSLEGVPVTSWVVFGTYDHSKMSFVTFGRLIEAYMADAGTKFLQGFERQSQGIDRARRGYRHPGASPIDARQIALSADPVDLPQLDADQASRLRKSGLLPVRLNAASSADRPLLMRTSDMRLVLPDGRALQSTQFSDVMAQLQGVPTGGLYLLGPIGAMAEVYAANAATRAEREQLQKVGGEALFSERRLGKGEAQQGIAFFRLPEDPKLRAGMRLDCWVVDPVTGDATKVQAPLAGAR